MTWLLLERIFIIGCGGFLGAISRFGVFMCTKSLYKSGGLPIGALLVNTIGCFIMGVIAFLILHKDFEGHKFIETFLVTGFLGAFTTFSAFSFDVLKLIQKQDYSSAALIIAGNMTFSLIGVFLGFIVATKLHP